jgi:hypothetical protein
MWTFFLALASAAPDVDFLHTSDSPKSARYLKVDGQPARARLKNAKGPFEAWVWRDGRLARYRLWDGRTLVEEVRFDAVGDRWATLRIADGAVSTVVVHGRTDTEVDVSRWATFRYGAASVRLPEVQHDGDALASWPGDGAFRATWGPTGDPYSDAYRDGLVATCACEVVDRYTVFADGQAGAAYLVRMPGVATPRLAEVVAFPRPEGTLLIAFSAPTGFDPPGVDDPAARLAMGRAVLATLSFPAPERSR